MLFRRMIATMNPFQPGRGVLPPLLAGRDSELAAADERLDRMEAGRSPAEDLLFCGPRGNGKTALLLEIERRARERGMRVETLPTPALSGVDRLVRELQEHTGGRQGRFTGVQVAGFGATATPDEPTENIMRLLVSWSNATPDRPLVIVLDEVQSLAPEVAPAFFDGVQQAKPRAAPFLVLAAGTPDAPRRLRQAATYNERGFAQVPVGRLARSETKAALAEPAKAAGRPIAEDAAALLAEQSQDYPYFVQLLGSAAWKAADRAGAPDIPLSLARRGAAEAVAPIERFYEGRYEEAESRRIEPVLKPLALLFAEHGGEVPASALKSLLRPLAERDSVPFDDLGLRQELTDLGVVWSVRPGTWELGIPSFADYLFRRG